MYKRLASCGVIALLLASHAVQAQAPRNMADLFSAAQTQQMLMQMEVALAKVQARANPPQSRDAADLAGLKKSVRASGRPWTPQVVIEHDPRVGTHRAVGSVHTAAECLLSGWPTEGRGKAYAAAVKACRAALEGTGDAESARLAFIAAAQEVGVFVRAEAPKG